MQENPDEALLPLLQSLLDLPALDLATALTSATTKLAEWLGCDKADAFLLDERRASLVAVGTSLTPLGERQKALGLDVLPLANGGRLVATYQTGESYVTGRAELDEEELVGIVRDLGVRSEINVAFEVGGKRRGALTVVSQRPELFAPSDVRVLELVGRWVGAIAQRAELVEQLRLEESHRSRLAAAERIITIVSHDIRNQLNPLVGRLYALQLRLRQGQVIDAASFDSMLRAARRLERLTSTWLDLSRLDQGLFELRLAPLDLAELLQDTSAALSTAGIVIHVEAPKPLTMIGDAERLRQAFENVLANAVRYSPPGRTVEVSAVTEPAGRVHVRIADQGPGIPTELLPHLFERFVASARSSGIGLGLYLAERIASAHGGALTARNARGAGAEFDFELPLEAESA